MRTRLFWILPLGRGATTGAGIGFCIGAGVGRPVSRLAAAGRSSAGPELSTPFKQSKMDKKNAKRLIGSREDETDDPEIKSLCHFR